jgi:hypothetical protein
MQALFRDRLTQRVLRRPVGIHLVICDKARAQVTWRTTLLSHNFKRQCTI